MIDVIVWVTLALDAADPVPPDAADEPVVRPPPPPVRGAPVAPGVVSAGATVLVGDAPQGTVAGGVEGGAGTGTVVVVVVVVVVAAGVVSTGVLPTGMVPAGEVSGVVVDDGVVVVVCGVVAGTVVLEQSGMTSGDDSAAGFVERAVVDGVTAAVAAGVTLELVWPSMRCSTGNVADNCTMPSTRSVVVRSPVLTVAVLKIDGVWIADDDFGLWMMTATAAPPARARHTTAMAILRPR